MFSAILLSFGGGSVWDQLLYVITELPASFRRPVPRFDPLCNGSTQCPTFSVANGPGINCLPNREMLLISKNPRSREGLIRTCNFCPIWKLYTQCIRCSHTNNCVERQLHCRTNFLWRSLCSSVVAFSCFHYCSAVSILHFVTFVFIGRFECRLLHPGANTADIITQYISSIKVRGLQYKMYIQTNKQTNKQKTYKQIKANKWSTNKQKQKQKTTAFSPV